MPISFLERVATVSMVLMTSVLGDSAAAEAVTFSASQKEEIRQGEGLRRAGPEETPQNP